MVHVLGFVTLLLPLSIHKQFDFNMDSKNAQKQQLLPDVTTGSSSISSSTDETILELAQQHPLALSSSSSTTNLYFSYGTAGFRYKADILNGVMLRVGMAAALLPTLESTCQIGVMVTASHNDESYNGVKYSAADGGMIGPDDEALAVEIVNAPSPAELIKLIRQKQQQSTITASTIHIGRDTRSHSLRFSELVVQGALAVNPALKIVNHGVVTTPMLHHAVMHANGAFALPALIPPRRNVIGYLQLLAHSYVALLSTAGDCSNETASLRRPQLTVDSACGVGYAALQGLCECLQSLGCLDAQRFVAVNPPGAGPLNHGCGSEHVQKSLEPPIVYGATSADNGHTNLGAYCCSFDGDADRIVFYSREQPSMYLLDGDKMATLICAFLREQLDVLQAPIRLGVVQTAYANGASTDYLRKFLGEESVAIAKTGVKYVHASAHQFDIGVYFEANGHGTVVFGQAFYDYVATCKPRTSAARIALARLRVLPSMVNQAVGDALSDMLLIDAILCLQNMSIGDWNAMYSDLPSRQLKVLVKDRSIIKVNENETKCLEPPQVQDELDRAMRMVRGRAFVRPSGTEDVVRVYAEAPTREAADELAKIAAQIVDRLCGGEGSALGSKL
ncbi:hypothetical protein MPSEU_000401300 [Mayamaea pseudoterrestris]|nr:hypothetical protein MPSEU_000401300 [Mayamaea pseudoterrestris]